MAEAPIPRARITPAVDVIGKTAATLIFDPDRQYPLVCPMWRQVIVRLLPGEILRDYGAPNGEEWIIQPSSSSVNGEEVVVFFIKSTPLAPVTDFTVTTDKNIYMMQLLPSGKGVNRNVRLVRFRDPNAELLREEARIAKEERRRQRALEPKIPTLNTVTARTYQVSGPAVVWHPVSVTGDDVHTFIKLPSETGAELPILTVMRDGEYEQPNYRTVRDTDGRVVLVVDGPVRQQAKLTGMDGEVLISGGN